MHILFVPLLCGMVPAYAQDTAPPGSGGQSFPGLMNPSISANGLFLAGAEWDDGTLAPPGFALGESDASTLAGKGETFGTGLSVQEMEVQLQSVVDPYFKANIVLAIPGTEGIEVEEGYVTLTSLPRVLVNVGKIKEPFGKENLTHTHALLTIDRALISQRVFGEEGLNDVSVNAQAMLPLPWYSEVTVGVDAGQNDVVLGSGNPQGVGVLGHWKNLVDLSDTYTAELGVSGLTGQSAEGGQSVVGGVDLTIKGHGGGRHQFNRLVWQNELILFDRFAGNGDVEKVGGLYSTLEGSFSSRFWLGGRFDMVGLPEPVDGGTTFAATAIAVYAPTEFSGFRLQAQRQFLPGGHTADSITGQLDFTIGTHPAHAY
jgi:hypothetical protein